MARYQEGLMGAVGEERCEVGTVTVGHGRFGLFAGCLEVQPRLQCLKFGKLLVKDLERPIKMVGSFYTAFANFWLNWFCLSFDVRIRARFGGIGPSLCLASWLRGMSSVIFLDLVLRCTTCTTKGCRPLQLTACLHRRILKELDHHVSICTWL